MDFDYCEENLRTISNKIFICSVKISIPHSVDIYRNKKNQTLTFSELPCAHEALKRRNVMLWIS